MQELPFDELAEFIREWARFDAEKRIRPDTQFERDLGVTGDDGVYLLRAVEKHFSIQFSTQAGGYRELFGLGPNEYLFNGEAFSLWELLPFVKKSTVRAFTVGELHAAMLVILGRTELVEGVRRAGEDCIQDNGPVKLTDRLPSSL